MRMRPNHLEELHSRNHLRSSWMHWVDHPRLSLCRDLQIVQVQTTAFEYKERRQPHHQQGKPAETAQGNRHERPRKYPDQQV